MEDMEVEPLETGQAIVDTTEIDELASSATSHSLPFLTQKFSNTLAKHPSNNNLQRNSPKTPAENHHVPQLRPFTPQSLSTAKFSRLRYATARSGLVYDVKMRYHMDPTPESEDDLHPENPQRIREIYDELVDAGLAYDPNRSNEKSDYQLLRIPIRQATEDEIALIHSREHIQRTKDMAGYDHQRLKAMQESADSVYFHNLSYLCARYAAGGAIEACRAVLTGEVRNAVAVIRPPGHHAEHDYPAGFCFFNNVPIAARVMQKTFPNVCRRVMILDWDVHHGNGVQRAFYDDPNVLYISLHVYNHGTFYPNGTYGSAGMCGEGAGIGKNINIPWNSHKMGDADYIHAFQQVVMPVAVEFDPDLVLISAGFDAAEGDPLGDCLVTPAGFAHMTHMLMQLAKGRVIACLEGGYSLRAIAKSALAMTKTLMGEPPDRVVDLTPTRMGLHTVADVVRIQSKYWKCLFPKQVQQQTRLPAERLHDIVREWQAKKLFDEFHMSPLFILRDQLSKSFDNQVLATPNYYEERPLLLIFHDPPECMGYPDPMNNQLDLHNTFLTDISKSYVEWAVHHQFAVIDVNIPKHITDTDDDRAFEPASAEGTRAKMTSQIATYLWTNYIELSSPTHVFLLGIGDSYAGIVSLLSTHASALDEADCTFAFIANNDLRRVERADDDGASRKFFQRSMVFVAADHSAWDPGRKLKRRYGTLVRSPETTLQEMLFEHRDEVAAVMLQKTAAWRAEQAARQAEQAAAAAAAAEQDHDMRSGDTTDEDEGSGNGSGNGNGNGNGARSSASASSRKGSGTDASVKSAGHGQSQSQSQSQNQSQNQSQSQSASASAPASSIADAAAAAARQRLAARSAAAAAPDDRMAVDSDDNLASRASSLSVARRRDAPAHGHGHGHNRLASPPASPSPSALPAPHGQQQQHQQHQHIPLRKGEQGSASQPSSIAVRRGEQGHAPRPSDDGLASQLQQKRKLEEHVRGLSDEQAKAVKKAAGLQEMRDKGFVPGRR